MILLTGRSGFIGSAFARHLLENDIRYATISRKQLENPSKMGSVTHIVHCAANPCPKPDRKNPDDIMMSNVVLTNRILSKYCDQIKRFTLLSSVKVYGSNDLSCEEETPCNPDCPYGVSKLAAEELVRSYSRTYGFDHCILRLSPVVGKKQTHGIMKDFTEKARSSSPHLDIIGGQPGSIRPYVHVKDVVRVMVNENLLGTFNVASSNLINNEQLAKAILDGLGLQKPIRFLGEDSSWKGDTQIMNICSDLIRDWGWMPEFDTAEKAVKHAIHF